MTGAVVAAIATIASLLPAAPAAAHGDVDQATRPGAEPCSTSVYPGSKLITTGESRQSFVPVLPGLTAVELCLQDLVGITGTDVTVRVYRKGQASAPDEVVATKEYDAGSNLLAAQWVHIDFDQLVATTPGTKYAIGLTPARGALSSVSFQWRATCDNVAASCDLLHRDDVYPQGETNDLPGNADYAFRTIAPPPADLIADASVDPAVCPGLKLVDRATGTVTNASTTAVTSFATRWMWSSDNAVSSDDRIIAGGQHTVPGLVAGGSAAIPPPTLPPDLPFGPGYLLLQVDVANQVRETDEANNLAAPGTTVTACAQPDIATLELSVVEAEVQAGFGEVQFDDLSSRALASLPQSPAETQSSPAFQPNGFSPNGFSPNGFSPNGFSANGFSPNGFSPNGFSPNGFSPNGFSPNGFSPNGFSPNGFSPAGGVLLRSLLDDLSPSLVRSMHVTDIPIVGDGWETRLSGATSEPIQGVTLDEAITLLPDIRVDEVDLTRVLSTTWMGLAFANAPLQSIPIDWCAVIAEHGSTCVDLGVDPASTSLLGLEGAGFPSHVAPIASMTLSNVAPDDRWLAMGLPMSGTASFHLGLTDIGHLAANEALSDPSAIVDCSSFDCRRPLVEAQTSGAIRNVSVGAFVAALSPTGRERMTLGDLAMGIATLGSLRLSAANWNLADVPAMDPACAPVTYRLSGTNAGAGAAIDPTAEVTLPAGFVYVPGSVALAHDGSAGADQPEPASAMSASGVRTYTFQLDAEINSSFVLTFSACANEYLGSVDAGSARVSGLGINGVYERSTTSTDEIMVKERTPGVTTTPVGSSDNIVIADHIASAGAYDSFTFPVKPEPGTLYIVKLFPPVGVDYDLLAFGPESSALSFNPNGFSPNGFSPNGFSPNGFSPNGFSPNGFSPNGFSPNGFSPNGFSPNGFSTTLAPDLLDDLPLRELKPAASSGVAVSANRGDTTETLHLIGKSGDSGSFTFSVADYNGARSDAPYFLTIQTVRPAANPALATCATTPWDLSATPGEAPTSWTGATPPRTLFVTNRQVTASAYGAAAADAGITALRELAQRPEIRGIVLNVDSDPDVRAAYAGWRSAWCDPTAANVVATQVRRKVLALREQYRSIDTIVLAGGDSILPDFRLDDRSAMANEDQYTSALLRATRTNNPLVAAFANGMIPSADPYGNEAALPFGMSYAFPPSAGVSRLVERPSAWALQRDQYLLADGALDPTSAFISAYDGMVDGAQAAAAALQGANVPSTLLTDESRTWTADDFRAGAFLPDGASFAGWNGHANHFGLLSDDGSERNDVSEQVTTAESDRIPGGAFVFSNGCHFGTAIDDVLNSAPTTEERTRLKDWAQAITGRSGIAVANSGFGIFDTLEVAQGERLHQYFLEEMNRSANVSLALAKAKNRFFASPGVYDAYTYKTMHQLSIYGLGIFRMFGSSTDPASAAPPADTDRIAVDEGPYALDDGGATSCTDCYRVTATPSGSRVELRDSQAETSHTAAQGYWSAPMSIKAVPLPADKAPAGVWINRLESVTLHDRDLVNTRLGVSDPSTELEPQTAAPFPTALGTVNTVGSTAYVSLMHGIAVPERKVNGKVTGDIHLYTSIDADLLLRPTTTNGCKPTIAAVTPTRLPESDRVSVEIQARETCAPTTRAAALGRLSDGSWIYAEAANAGSGRWLTSFVVPAGTTLEDLVVQVSNGLDVGYWRFKGDRPVINEGFSEGVDLVFSGERHSTGIYRSTVTATVVGTPGVVYRVYDKDAFLGTFANGESVTVAGDGPHELAVFGSDGSHAGRVVVIDTTTPTITWISPAADAQVLSHGQIVPVEVLCADASGTTCSITVNGTAIANGSALPTNRVGSYTISVSSVDGVGNAATSTRTYTVTSRYTISEFFSPIKAKPQLNVTSPSANLTLRFRIHEGSVEQTDPALIASKYWQPINCSSKAPSGATFQTAGSNPEYSGFFHFNIAAPSPAGCYSLYVELVDGSTQSAYFQVKR